MHDQATSRRIRTLNDNFRTTFIGGKVFFSLSTKGFCHRGHREHRGNLSFFLSELCVLCG